MSASWAIWLTCITTVALWSYLVGDNKLFKLVEHLYVGAAGGHAITMAFTNIRDLGWTPMVTKGQVEIVIPMLLGLVLFARLTKTYAWVARYAVAVTVGIGTGVNLRGVPSAQIISQLQATMSPIKGLNDIIMVLGVLGTIVYFVFIGPKGYRNVVTNSLATYGRWTMMITFGVGFGTSAFSMVARATGAVTNILKAFDLVK
jgi:hypothetical protein